MKSARSDILRLSENDFVKWLRTGLVHVPHPVSAPPDETDVLVKLPAKYGRLVDRGQTFVALIDEIIGVSKLTPDLTREFSARLRNLGEAWLPILHHPEWLSDQTTTTSMPIEPTEKVITPPLDNNAEATSVKKNVPLDSPETTGQGQHLSRDPDDEDAHELPSPASEQQAYIVRTSNAALTSQPSTLPPVQASQVAKLPHTGVEEQVKPDGPAPKDRKRSSTAKTDKGGTTIIRAKQVQSSLLPGTNGDPTDRQSEDVHD